MDVISNKEEMIFKNERDGKVLYSIGLSRRNQNGDYENGYMSVRFRKAVNLTDARTKIKIKSAWLDFYKVDKKTLPYIFISDFEIINEQQKAKEEDKSTYDEQGKLEWDSASKTPIDDDDLPFYG